MINIVQQLTYSPMLTEQQVNAESDRDFRYYLHDFVVVVVGFLLFLF